VKWVEIIRLRSQGDIQDSVIDELLRSVANGDQGDGLISMKVYRNAWVNADVSVHLHWKSSSVEPSESALGVRLAELFKEFGLINHSAWVEHKSRRTL